MPINIERFRAALIACQSLDDIPQVINYDSASAGILEPKELGTGVEARTTADCVADLKKQIIASRIYHQLVIVALNALDSSLD